MRNVTVKNFMMAVEEAASYLKRISFKKATIVHHNDTDGIASGALLKEALQREGFQTENVPLERIHPSFLPKIHTSDRKLILYADFGGQGASIIGQHALKGSSIFILDHHPPNESTFPDLWHINPELFGIDGDMSSSAATVTYFFTTALNPNNKDLSYLGVIGAIGDNQIKDGGLTGLNQIAMELALATGDLSIDRENIQDPFRLRLFEDEGGTEVGRTITDLSVNGYYRRGADLGIRFCLRGHNPESLRFCKEMREIQENLFKKERKKIANHGVSVEGDFQWIDVEDRFFPLGLKSIGIFCNEISTSQWIHPDKYIVGFQNFPKENPYLGRFEGDETKVSMRVPPALHRAIEEGSMPNLTDILPKAAEVVGGFSEGCHRYAAACTIHQTKRMDLIKSLQQTLN